MVTNKAVLIIDDEQGYRDLYKFMLAPMGYNVTQAADGEEGLKMFAEGCFDIILLDVHMPKMNGPDVLKQILAIHPDQKVIVFTSSSDLGFTFETQAKKLGAFDCLYKPVEIGDIIKALNQACSQN